MFPGHGYRCSAAMLLRRHFLDPLAEPGGELLDEPPQQQRDIVGPISQWRHAQREYVEPIKQVRPERAVDVALFEAAMRRGDDPRVDLDRLDAPEPFDLPLFQDPQQLHLHIQWQVANLVEENRRAIRPLEPSDLLRDRVGVGAFSRPKSSLSINVAGIAAQFTHTISRARRRLQAWM